MERRDPGSDEARARSDGVARAGAGLLAVSFGVVLVALAWIVWPTHLDRPAAEGPLPTKEKAGARHEDTPQALRAPQATPPTSPPQPARTRRSAAEAAAGPGRQPLVPGAPRQASETFTHRFDANELAGWDLPTMMNALDLDVNERRAAAEDDFLEPRLQAALMEHQRRVLRLLRKRGPALDEIAHRLVDRGLADVYSRKPPPGARAWPISFSRGNSGWMLWIPENQFPELAAITLGLEREVGEFRRRVQSLVREWRERRRHGNQSSERRDHR